MRDRDFSVMKPADTDTVSGEGVVSAGATRPDPNTPPAYDPSYGPDFRELIQISQSLNVMLASGDGRSLAGVIFGALFPEGEAFDHARSWHLLANTVLGLSEAVRVIEQGVLASNDAGLIRAWRAGVEKRRQMIEAERAVEPAVVQ